MGRPVVLSNGQLFVGLDESGLVHDFYYPYVGLDNLTNARSLEHQIGVWVDGKFSWVNDGSWKIDVKYEPGVMVGHVTMLSQKLSLQLETSDYVDDESNAFIRSIKVTNMAQEDREIRVFMHQVFKISRDGRADTAMYVPDDHYILDYKGRCCILIAGKVTNADGSDGPSFDQYAVGNYNIEGKAGTFVDAEDGELSDNPVEHGGVDSVIRFTSHAAAGQSFNVDYWVIAADSQTDGQAIHTKLKYYSIGEHTSKVRSHWKQWLAASHKSLEEVPEEQRIETEQSLLIIKAHCDERGGILASGDSSIFNFGRDYYCYCWPRDAAYALWPMLRAGLFHEAQKFFAFARDTMHSDGYLMHKYQPDRAIGSTWHPLIHGKTRELAIQEDETAIVVFMIGEYYKRSRDRELVVSYYDSFIEPCAKWMVSYVDEATGLPHASYDLWEEKFLTSTYTVSTVIAALETAGRLAEVAGHIDDASRWQLAADNMRAKLPTLMHPDGYFRKGYLLQPDGSLQNDDAIDISSLFGSLLLANLSPEDPMIVGTLKKVEDTLLDSSPIGGVIRYNGDNYFRAKQNYLGNPWIVCSLWLAQVYASLGRLEDAKKLLDWSEARALPSGVFSEQFDPEDGSAISVTPLVWSHAEYINTVLDLRERKK
jgi:GH15 family glucan-1,4-alpha-glucosidase